MVEIKKKVLEGEKSVVVVESDEDIVTRRTSLFLAVGSFVLSLFFLSQNITGHAVLNFEKSSANWVGGILFILAIIGFLVYVQKKKK
ncbi:hypothetical protein KAT36_04320 [Candidatus Pacearchaeota archaeon]|nr:hypothetical protein [Candidatus Pacearchaeota archaeon]